MKKLKYLFLFSLAGGVSAGAASHSHAHKKATAKSGHGAHVHGKAKLTIALEGPTQGSLELHSPGESIVGFEYTPKTEADKKTQAQALESLRTKASEFFVFDSSARCVFKKSDVRLGAESSSAEAGHGEHRELEAEYDFLCEKSVVGTFLKVQLGKTFNKIKNLEVQVLQDKSQNSTTLPGALGEVKF